MTSTLSGLGTRRRPRRLPILPLFSWLFIALALGLLILELIRFSQEVDRLGADVQVAGIQVGGLSAAEAVRRWEEAFAQPVTLWYNDSPIQLDPADIGFRTDRDTMLAAAGAAAAGEAAFWTEFVSHLTGQQSQRSTTVQLTADYQPNVVRSLLRDISARYDRQADDAGYDVTTLTLRPGASGFALNIDAALPLIDAALRDPVNRQVRLPLSNANDTAGSMSTLRDLIIAYLDSQGFSYDSATSVASVFIMDLETGEELNILSDVAMSAASTIKVGILINSFRDLLFAPDNDIAFLMAQSLLCSNNSSSNLLMQVAGGDDLFAGIAQVTNTLQTIGARNTYLSAPLYLGGDQILGSIPAPLTAPNTSYNTGADPYNQTTTEDLGTTFSMIYDCATTGSGLMTVYPDDFTQQECRQMLELMSANDLERLLQGGIPADARITHKNGWLEDVHGDAGIVYAPNGRNYVIAVFLWEQGDFFSYTRAWTMIEGISRATWNYFVPDQPLIAPRPDVPPDRTAQDCIVFSPPYEQVNLDNINAWRAAGS
ncbi:MAG: serine hydrolase [Chloroflexota bacterium]|nr:serine hydrolase [Chloroflexota bacterium]